MAKARLFYVDFWDDEKISELSPLEKLLLIYLSNNSRTKESGIIKITERTISFETGIPIDTLSKGIDTLSYPIHTLLKGMEEKGFITVDKDYIFIHGFLRRNGTQSARYLKGIARELGLINSEKIVKKFNEIYDTLLKGIHTLCIPYRGCLDKDMNKDKEIKLESELEEESIIDKIMNKWTDEFPEMFRDKSGKWNPAYVIKSRDGLEGKSLPEIQRHMKTMYKIHVDDDLTLTKEKDEYTNPYIIKTG
jgi:hypothetical protein